MKPPTPHFFQIPNLFIASGSCTEESVLSPSQWTRIGNLSSYLIVILEFDFNIISEVSI